MHISSDHTFCMRAFKEGRVARSTWMDSCSRERQVCASAASIARNSKGNVRSIELHGSKVQVKSYSKTREEKTTPFSVKLTRSLVTYQAGVLQQRIRCTCWSLNQP